MGLWSLWVCHGMVGLSRKMGLVEREIPPPRLCNPDQLLALWTKTVSKFVEAMETGTKDSGQAEDKESSNKTKCVMNIQGYPVKGLSIAGHETCIIFPSLNIAFDIGRCPHQAIQQDFLCISHAHMDHIGGLPMYVATRGLYRMKPPTIIVPTCIKADVEQLFEVHRRMDQSELKHNLIGLDVGEEFYLRKDLKVRAFKTYHVIPSQGYVVYSVKQKLKQEYIGLPGNEIKNLKLSGVEITYTVTVPEIAFTGDTMSDFIVDQNNIDALRSRILCTFVDNSVQVEGARDYGHTHISEIIGHAERFENKAILLIHFSARHTAEEIQQVVSALPSPLAGRVFVLTEGF
ncbi:tRNase Z TRZ1-like isoform X2 [Quercus robur]|uniref:tRNase Z TRZ1-like isoform X2 n=1 Tax=Quercus robur TaxID=38942 RepID=UPI0021625E1E|nr:tRNase Z TRZ1-like isoform X2 [Quercus robur]